MMTAQLTGVDPGNLKDFLTLTLVLGLAVVQLLTYLRSKRPAASDGHPSGGHGAHDRYVDREVCQSMHGQTEHRIKRLELAEQALRVELADIRREMKADREAMQTVFRDEIGRVHERLNDVFVCVAELRGPGRHQKP